MLDRIRTFIRQYSQWFTPIVVFVIAVFIILAFFLDHTEQDSKSRAQAEAAADALDLERTVEQKLAGDQAIARMMARSLEGSEAALFDGAGGSHDALVRVLTDAEEAGDGYLALAVRQKDGAAYSAENGKFSVAALPWYAEITNVEQGKEKLFHLTDDGLTGADAVVNAVGFSLSDGSTGVCLYFDGTWIDTLSVTGKGKALMTIVDLDGTILMRSTISDYFIRGENYWKLIGTNVAASAKYHITRGSNYAIFDAAENYTVIEIPIRGSLWAACVSVGGNYIDTLADNYFQSTRRLVIDLLVAVVAFFAMIIIINMISKAKRLKESKALGEKADHDQLTGLRNKAATERDIQEFMDQNPTTQSLLFILDIDDFKSVNDTMGHSFGDDVLHEFGFRLGSMFRASDIAGRIGGDEFMVFVKNIPNEDTIEKEAKKIREFIQSFRAGENVKREVTASSGAAVFPADGADFDTLYKSADKALYESKRSGKRQLSFFRH